VASSTPDHSSEDDRIGLCAGCRHHETVVSARGAAFHLCRLSFRDPRFRRYPPLPVRQCEGFDAAESADSSNISIDGTVIHVERAGAAGPPVVLVHGSWVDHRQWHGVMPALAARLRVLAYDRRGHSMSERDPRPHLVRDDIDDLAGLIAAHADEPAHVIGNSLGGTIALKLAARRPELFASLIVHEPPLVRLLEGHPTYDQTRANLAAVVAVLDAGRMEEGARLFVETVSSSPGAWQRLPRDVRETFVHNAPMWRDEMKEPEALAIDLAALARFDRPVLLTHGAQSPAFLGAIVERMWAALPHWQRYVFQTAGHAPHVTQPDEFVRVVVGFIDSIR
jgi:pimeloyl-ACP methyl ester carboxylesterase